MTLTTPAVRCGEGAEEFAEGDDYKFSEFKLRKIFSYYCSQLKDADVCVEECL